MFLKVFTNKQGNALYYMRSVRKPGRKNPTSEKVEFLLICIKISGWYCGNKSLYIIWKREKNNSLSTLALKLG